MSGDPAETATDKEALQDPTSKPLEGNRNDAAEPDLGAASPAEAADSSAPPPEEPSPPPTAASPPAQTEPNQTEPNQTEPNQTEPNQTEPNQTEPNQTEPNQTETDQTAPADTAGDATPADAADSAAPTSDTASADTASADTASADAAASDAPPEGASAEAAGARPKIQIGSRRQGAAERPKSTRPQTHTPAPPSPAPPPPRSGPVPVPTVRSSSEELDQEVAAALGGESIEQIMSAEQPGAGQVLELDSRVPAQVVKVHGDDVFVSLGGPHQGVVSVRQFKTPPEPGQQLEVRISGVSRDDGLYDVSIPGAAVEVGDWSDLDEGAVVVARVTGSNTGGLECKVNTIRGFIPASQIAMVRVENLNDYLDQKLECVVTEVNKRRKNLVLSRRAVLEREQAEERKRLLEELQVGLIREGVVRSLRDFGAFVDLGGVDGLIHVSQLSWERVDHPKDVLQQGEKVRVKIEKIDPQSGKIGLSYRSLQDHPWTGVEERFPVGATIDGVVSRAAKFGAFVRLAPGVEGLVHISELAHHRVSLVTNVVKEGQEVTVKVLTVDPEAQRIGLSIKQTTEAPKSERARKPAEEEPDEPRDPLLPKHKGPLKGGVDGPSGGEKFGLKW